MVYISELDFKNLIKTERKEHFITPFELVYETFVDLGYHLKDTEYFMEHASEYITIMRKECWNRFIPKEREFTTRMLTKLIDVDKVKHQDPITAIQDFTLEYPYHIYDLSLSNTQSRRSRAGKEFEAIIELLLIGADIPADTQGAIGKTFFQVQQIGKLVDFVTPSVVEYMANKRNTMLISAKTTLRERWQEVPEEVSRTGIREMYLATLDESISDESLKIMYEANIIIVTTKNNKELNYKTKNMVISFEEMLHNGKEIASKWNNYEYSEYEKKLLKENAEKQIKKFQNFEYVKNYYQNKFK